MENFILYNPVKLHFGSNVTEILGKTAAKYGNRVLLVYGGGSIKRNGIYDQILSQLNASGLEIVEYSGIKPNPVIEDVDKAAALGREKNVDLLVAVGGGSVIDSAKIISITIPVNHSGWEFMKNTKTPERAIPLIAVLTLAATGTEMNRFAVVQNVATKEKLGYGHRLTYPIESFLDPSFTLSVPKNYTGYGIADLTAHCLEAYFGEGEATLSDRFVYAIIREAIKYGVPLMDDLNNYALREKIMYAATCALNNLTSYGRKNGDWGVHAIGHILSLLYDTPHGASLTIAFPAYLKLLAGKISPRIIELGKNVFGVDTVEKTIFELENFFSTIDCPLRLSDIGIGPEKFEEIYQTMVLNKVTGNHHKLNPDDYRRLLELMR